jgi:N-acyl-D-aspartate/D-glutamate deacylase
LAVPRVFQGRWDRAFVNEVSDPSMKKYLGRSVADVARERNADPLDTFLDLAIEDGLELKYAYEMFNATDDRMPALITDQRAMISLSDGGAHVDMLCDAGYPTYLLGYWVREKEALSLEHAVRRITSEPAAFYGMAGRGSIANGMAADFAIFDASTVGSPRRGELRHDLPFGKRRLVVPASGMEYTVVNGIVLFQNGKHSGSLPGKVIRGNVQ